MEIEGFEGLDALSDGLKIEKISEDDEELFQNENHKNDQEIIKLEVQEKSCQAGVKHFSFKYSLIHRTCQSFCSTENLKNSYVT